MRDVLSITKALSDENRLRVICALADRELCVCQITELLGLASSTVSKHMSVLHNARLVESRKEGRWMYYRLAEADSPREAMEALAWIRRSLGKAREIVEDRRRLKAILKRNPEEICRKQHGS